MIVNRQSSNVSLEQRRSPLAGSAQSSAIFAGWGPKF
jgi:hypothetical protein